LQEAGVQILIYEPSLADSNYLGVPLIATLEDFKARADLIVANRVDKKLEDVAHKLFSRDLFGTG
jgi:UDPglucose 6-dehydrogenase